MRGTLRPITEVCGYLTRATPAIPASPTSQRASPRIVAVRGVLRPVTQAKTCGYLPPATPANPEPRPAHRAQARATPRC
jgi:hypothetical protein